MAATAIDLLTKRDVLGKAREEHQRRIGDRKYKSPIPADNKPPVNIWNK
jgi:aminobenzoyl-glutamate utilization protein B